MSGAFTTGGLITGLNTNQIIQQLMQLERQPITRLQERVQALEDQQGAVRDLRTQLATLRNRAKDFRYNGVFGQFNAVSSEATVLAAAASGASPAIGSYAVNVTQLATATAANSSAKMGAAINPAAALNSSGMTTEITAGTFTINGVQFTVDPTTQSLNTILAQITASAAGVNATYDAPTDKVVLTNQTAGSSSIINLGATGDGSNFLAAINVKGATQGALGDGTTQVTSTRNLGAVDPSKKIQDISFAGGAVTAGAFRVNGISISIDPTTDTLSEVLGRITNSDAGVSASYDATNDTIRVISKNLGSRTIAFGTGSDTSNFLTVTNLSSATQTAGKDAQFTVNGGPTITRSTNEVSDAISGVTLNLLSIGASTVTVSSDDDGIVEGVKTFLDEVNKAISSIQDMTREEGRLQGDGSIRAMLDYLRSTVFSAVSGISGDFSSLLDVGISTGDTFDAATISAYELDEDEFREALRDDRANVQSLFSNSGSTGIADRIASYLDDATSLSGFLNVRARSNGLIDQEIQADNDRIAQLERRVTMHEDRLRAQFAQMEQLAAGFQQQNSAISGLSNNLLTLSMLM